MYNGFKHKRDQEFAEKEKRRVKPLRETNPTLAAQKL